MTNPSTKKPGIRKWHLGILLALVGLAIAGIAMTAPDTSRQNWPSQFTSEGQRLYFTGQSAAGQRLLPEGGNHHMTMMGTGACVDCHGTDREGGRLWPALWRTVPAITFTALTGEHGHDGHDHDTYSAQTLSKAITEGTRPDGSKLGPGMPRWSTAPQSLDQLVKYLLSPPETY